MPDVTYRQLQAVLAGLGSVVGAAEAHGCLCGALCAREDYAAPEWVGELIEPGSAMWVDGPARGLLEAVHRETLVALRSQDFVFAPLVPEDDGALVERVRALADWCGGFLYGVGAGGAGRELAAADDIGEILRDLGEIARAQPGPQQATDTAEGEFAELFEFVRAGAQLAFDELAATRAVQLQGGGTVH